MNGFSGLETIAAEKPLFDGKTLAGWEGIGEELRPVHETADRIRTLVSHPWLVDQLDAIGAKNSALA